MLGQRPGLTGISKKGAGGLRPSITDKVVCRSLQYKLFKTHYCCFFESDWHLFYVVED